MIVVTTPTGNIGSQVVPLLLAAGESVRVIARDPSKLSSAIRGKVEVVQGSAADAAVIDKAFKGAESVFWVVPPDFSATNIDEYYLAFTRPAAAAIKTHGIERVVSVSSLGRNLGRKDGVISSSHAKDALLESTGVHFRALWCPGFMENMLRQIEPLKHQGMFFLPSKPDLKLPHAATRDIAASGAKLLLDKSWTGAGGLGVLGPQDVSPNDMAAIMTDVLGRPIRFQPVPGSAYKQTLLSFGGSEAMAQSLVDMHAAIDEGQYNAEPRTRENTTPTSFRQWCEEFLKPALSG
jgi:uncharacterized protein YbjT (DUF2867 family)